MSVFRPGDVTYLRIPAEDPALLAEFYADVFDWRTRDGRAFEDASGSVIGHFSPEHAVAGEGGFRPYVYVASLADTLARVAAHGGVVVVDPYPEGNVEVAVIRDPAGNVLGVWTS
jgi:predicted enzyme related to lactoylglutathione lyase